MWLFPPKKLLFPTLPTIYWETPLRLSFMKTASKHRAASNTGLRPIQMTTGWSPAGFLSGPSFALEGAALSTWSPSARPESMGEEERGKDFSPCPLLLQVASPAPSISLCSWYTAPRPHHGSNTLWDSSGLLAPETSWAPIISQA